MSIFADQVSMPTFGMTQYSGDWRSKARANIAARENAMLQQMAEATDPQTQIDTGMAQLSSFFNPETEEESDIDKLVNVLSMVNQGADPKTVAAVNAAQSAGEADAADKEAREKGLARQTAEIFFADPEGSFTSDEAVGQNILQYPVVGGAMAAAGEAARRKMSPISGLPKDRKAAKEAIKKLAKTKEGKGFLKILARRAPGMLARRGALAATGIGAIPALVSLIPELAYIAAEVYAPETTTKVEEAVGGTLKNIGGGIMDMFRGDDNFQVGQNTKKAHGGRVHKFSGGIMSAAGMAFPQFINQIANPVQNQITNPVQTNILPSPNVMLPYTPFMTPEYAAQYYSQNFGAGAATPAITPAVMPTSTGTTTSDPGNIASNVGSPVGAGAVGYGSPAAPIFAQPQRGGEGNPNANATTIDAFGNTVPANSTAYGIDPATGNLVASFVPSHTTMISVGDPAPAPLQQLTICTI